MGVHYALPYVHNSRLTSEEREVSRKQLREKMRRERAQQLAEERKELTTDDDGEQASGRRYYYARRGRASHASAVENATGRAAADTAANWKKDDNRLVRLARALMSSSGFDNQLYGAVLKRVSSEALRVGETVKSS